MTGWTQLAVLDTHDADVLMMLCDGDLIIFVEASEQKLSKIL